jgi:hypothetical protein
VRTQAGCARGPCRARRRAGGRLGGRLVVIVTASNASTSYAVASPASAAVAPRVEEVQASLTGQSMPHDRTLAVAIGLQTKRGYRLTIGAPVTGVVSVDWYLGTHSQLPADRGGLLLVAGGSSQIRRPGPSAVQIHATARGTGCRSGTAPEPRLGVPHPARDARRRGARGVLPRWLVLPLLQRRLDVDRQLRDRGGRLPGPARLAVSAA